MSDGFHNCRPSTYGAEEDIARALNIPPAFVRVAVGDDHSQHFIRNEVAIVGEITLTTCDILGHRWVDGRCTRCDAEQVT